MAALADQTTADNVLGLREAIPVVNTQSTAELAQDLRHQ
jgi:hypothetical protein